MLKVLLIFILLSVQPLFFISKLKQRFEVILPVCCMADILVILAFGMVFKNLTAGVVAVFVLAAASLISAVYFERKDLGGFLSRVATPGFYAWCVGYCLMWAFSYKQFFSIWDDFMHWGVFVKQMFYHNMLYTDPDIQILKHKYYPPAISLFEYMFTRIWGSYSEAVVFAAYRILLYVGVLPFTKFFYKKENIKAIALSLTAFFSLFLWEMLDNASYTINVDAHLSVLFALYVFFVIFDKDNPLRIYNLCILGISLVLTKVTGFEFALVGMGLYIIIEFVKLRKMRIHLKSAINLSLIVIWSLPLVVYGIWNLYTNNIPGEMAQINAPDTLGKITEIISWLTLNGGEIKNNVLSAAAYLWLTMEMTSGWIPLNNPILLIVFIILLYFLKNTEKDKTLLVNYNILMIIVPLGYIIYSLSLIIINLRGNALISRTGAGGVNSFDRYLVTYIAGMYLIILFILIRKSSISYNKNDISRRYLVCFAIIFVFCLLPSREFRRLGPFGNDGYDASEYKTYTRTVKKIQTYAMQIEKRGKVYVVYCDDSLAESDIERLFWKNQYWLKPTETNSFLRDVSKNEEPVTPYLKFNTDIAWGVSLIERKFSHVLLNDVNDNFKNRFFKIFDCTYAQIRAGTLYKIVENDLDGLPVKLVPVDVPIYSY